MLTTNILPPQEENILRLEKTRRTIVLFSSGWIAVWIISFILILPSYFSLFAEYKELERAAKIEEEGGRRLRVSKTASNARNIKNIMFSVKNSVSLPAEISKLFNSIFSKGTGIIINEMIIQKKENLIINGMASTRKSLLEFEKKLRDSSHIQNLSSPLSNIIKETNINFTLQGKLKL